jgi:glycyl-tRNA synthetase beta chain
VLFKRAKNITKDVPPLSVHTLSPDVKQRLTEPAELALIAALESRANVVRNASAQGQYREAFAAIGELQPSVAKFFDDVLVMADEEGLRKARLELVAMLRDLILGIADISEIVTES